MESVTIAEVTDKGNGWYEISLEGDDRVLSTKKERLAELANASVGSPVEVEINTKPNGTFTNHYLESVNGEKGGYTAAATKPATRTKTTKIAAAAPDNKQKDIAAQWAVGRAVELLVASDREFSFPLDAETLADVQLQAQANLAVRDKVSS